MNPTPHARVQILAGLVLWLAFATAIAHSQSLLNLDFAANPAIAKVGPAAAGQSTNDFWNPYSHYHPKFSPGMAPVADGQMNALKWADGSVSRIAVAVTNAPGVWGNTTGDPMLDTYQFANGGSNIVVTLRGFDPGRYHFFLYGHADADAEGGVSQDSRFVLRQGSRLFTNAVIFEWTIPGAGAGVGRGGFDASSAVWKASVPVVAYRDIALEGSDPVVIEVLPGRGGVAVLNGIQILSRGTAPPRGREPLATPVAPGPTNLVLRELHYEARLSRREARLKMTLDAESPGTNELRTVLFEGDLAMTAPKLPEGWRIVPVGRRFVLVTTEPGRHRLDLDLVPRVEVAEPWRSIRFSGPAAAVATLAATAEEPGVEIQLLAGTTFAAAGTATNSTPGLRGALGTDRAVSLRWQAGSTGVARDAVVGVDTHCRVVASPGTVRLTTELRLEVLQGRLPRLRIELPAGQTLNQLKGESVRLWTVATTNGGQVVNVEFLRPMDGTVPLTLSTEQPLPALPGSTTITPPRPVEVQREAGTLVLAAEDLLLRVEDAGGLRQANAGEGDVASFRFNSRPASVRAGLARIEPLVTSHARVAGRVEEHRWSIQHALDVQVARAGIYQLSLAVPAGMSVVEVRSDGLEDWKVEAGRLNVSYRERVLGRRRLEVGLEQSLTNAPSNLTVLPLRLDGAVRETAVVGMSAERGIILQASSTEGATEIPLSAFSGAREETLAFGAEVPGWRVNLGVERPPARVVGEVFNLFSVGDGVVGGSAMIRFGVLNQGVQAFRVRVPAHWRNVEFTGANIRRTDRDGDLWTLGLQDKVWGAYTLVVTCDAPMVAGTNTFDAAGVHLPDVEREEGVVAVTAVPGLTLEPPVVAEPLRRMDASELSAADRALIARPVLFAAQYLGTNFSLTLSTVRHSGVPLLDAIADRAQLATVLTDSGEMLTQAGFMVKNNDRQFQRFRLPPGAALWAVAVNGAPTKADRDGDWVLVPLPKTSNADELFAVDLKYAQPESRLGGWLPRALDLSAPTTDVAGTYAEWEVYVPASRHVTGFGGNMAVARGTTYGFRDGWDAFVLTYREIWDNHAGSIVVFGGIGAFLLATGLIGWRTGMSGMIRVLLVFAILAIFAGMLLPALSKAKSRAQRISSVNNLKNIGIALRTSVVEKENPVYPESLDSLIGELSTPKILADPRTGERYTYVGAGKSEENPWAIVAFSSSVNGTRDVLMADGSVQQVTDARFAELLAEEARHVAAAGGTAATTTNNNTTTAPALAARYGLANAGAAAAAAATRPAVPVGVGLRSLRIDLPRSGVPFRFTRTLNHTTQPAAVRLSLMSAKTYFVTRGVAQAAALLVGLCLAGFQWRRAQPSPLWFAVGLSIAIGAVASALVTWRVLHVALIVGVPAAVVLVVIVASARFVTAFRPARPTPPVAPPGHAAPAMAASVVLFLAGMASFGPLSPAAQGAESAAAGVARAGDDRGVIVSANYSGTAREGVAELDAVCEILGASTNQFIALFGPDVAVRELTVATGPASLARDGDRVGILFAAPGPASVRARVVAKVGGDVARRSMDFVLPPALSSRLALEIDEPDAQVEFPNALVLQVGPGSKPTKTAVDAVLGPGGRVALTWTPKVRRGAAAELAAIANQSSLVTLGAASVNVRGNITWTATQGELSRLRVVLPDGYRVLKLAGPAVRSWEQSASNRQELAIDLLKPAASAQVAIEIERSLDAAAEPIALVVAHALDVKREAGLLAVRGADEVGVELGQSTGLERIDPAEFGKAAGADAPVVQSAWRWAAPTFEVTARTSAVRPRIEAVSRNAFVVGPERVALRATADFTVSRAGVFNLQFALPPDGRVESVNCPVMQMWLERTNGPVRTLEITLKQRTLGAIAVQVDLARPLAAFGASLELAGVRPLGVDKAAGFVSVASEPGVGVKTSGLSGLVEIPASAMGSVDAGVGSRQSGLPPVPVRLAYKLPGGSSGAGDAWVLRLATERIASWVRAEGVQVFQVGESLVRGRMRVRYTVENAPVKVFRLRVPVAWRNVEFTGDDIRSRTRRAVDGGAEWTIESQNAVLGARELRLSWEQDRPPGTTNSVDLAGAELPGVDRETGFIIVTRHGQLQVQPRGEPVRLRRIDASELPEWTRDELAGSPPALQFAQAQPAWRLGLDVTQFADAAVLSALVESLRLRSVVADDGQWMTLLDMHVRHNGRQHIALTLPEGATVWSAFVDGQPVRPTQRGVSVLLPLERSAAVDSAIPVEMTFVGRVAFPGGSGAVELTSPRIDAPLKDARWEVFLPPDREYSKFGGTMNWESADLVPVAQDFTAAEYGRQESTKATLLASQTLDNLRQARTELAAGNLDRANDRLSQVRNLFGNNLVPTGELQQIETDLNRVQSSNLIAAQQNYLKVNMARYNVGPGAAVQKLGADEDARVAGLQVERLQRAQAVATSKVSPLRVNLPTRGLRHAFVQVLQTGVDKPLTIRFETRNLRGGGPVRPLAFGLVGFVVLWIGARQAIRRR